MTGAVDVGALLRSPGVIRIVHILAERGGSPLTLAELSEATGLKESGLESMARRARRAVRDSHAAGPAELHIRRSGLDLVFWATSLDVAAATALVGPALPPASYLGHTWAAGDLARILVESGGRPRSLAELGRLLLPGGPGQKPGQDKVREAAARIIERRRERGCAETVLVTTGPDGTWYAWGPAPTESDRSEVPDLDVDPDEADGLIRRERAEVSISLPSVAGRYVYTNRGLYLDGAPRPRHSDGAGL